MSAQQSDPLLSVRGLTVDYPIGRGQRLRAVDDVSFDVSAGRTVGLVGESGSGKSTIAKALVGLAPVSGGTITIDGVASGAGVKKPAGATRTVQMVFQDPYSSLDPTKTIGYSIAEPLRVGNEGKLSRQQISARVAEMLERVGMPAGAAKRYPSQYSGGQRQRIAIARALVVQPKLVICDESLSALDLSVQAQILNLLAEFQASHGVSYLFISHDLSVVEFLCDEVVVLYRGRVAETGSTASIHRTPKHPYTRGLVAAVPEVDPRERERARERRERLRTPVAPLIKLGDCCAYAHRCAFSADECLQQRPLLRPAGPDAQAACHRFEEVAAQLDTPASGAVAGGRS